jgi:large subunit ribosomal protein L15
MGKRSKRSRLRGRGACGYGHKSKHRGKGSKGGKGMAGTGKRAGQLRTWILKYQPDYFGKHGFHSLRKPSYKTISLGQIHENMHKFLDKGIAKKSGETIEINLKNYKILSNGHIKEKVIIKAKSFSKKAQEKVEKIGGKIEV